MRNLPVIVRILLAGAALLVLQACGTSSDSPPGEQPPQEQPPQAFSLLSAEAFCNAAGESAVELMWEASVGAEAYVVYRNGNPHEELVTLATEFEDTTNLTPGTTYEYRVQASNAAGSKDSTNTLTVTAVDCRLMNELLDAGGRFSLTVRGAGQVRAWGYNYHGQLGGGATAMRSLTPVAPSGLPQVTAVAASGGDGYALALVENGDVWGWGANADGQIAGVAGTSTSNPVKSDTLTGITAISAGARHAMALDDAGQVFTWGANVGGRVGHGTVGQSRVPVAAVAELDGIEIVSISAGGHSLAADTSGKVWAWGSNEDGQLGRPGTSAENSTPEQVAHLNDIHHVAAGAAHSAALDASGAVWVWGSNENGQLATTGSSKSSTPQKVNLPLPARTVVTDGNADFSLALLTDGTVWGWGSNSRGQLGNGTTTDSAEPVQVSGFSGVTGVAAGKEHALAITADGALWAWGAGGDGQLGNGHNTQRTTPVPVMGLPGF